MNISQTIIGKQLHCVSLHISYWCSCDPLGIQMNGYVYVCMNAQLYVSMCEYMSLCVHLCVCVRVCVHVCACVCMCVRVCA